MLRYPPVFVIYLSIHLSIIYPPPPTKTRPSQPAAVYAVGSNFVTDDTSSTREVSKGRASGSQSRFCPADFGQASRPVWASAFRSVEEEMGCGRAEVTGSSDAL